MLLQRAVEALAAVTQRAPAARWVVERRIERPESSTFAVRVAFPSDAPVPVYYKVFCPWEARRGPNFQLFVQEIRDGLTLCRDLQDRLTEMGASEEIQPARVLAADPDRLIVVTLHVPGRPLGKAVRRVITAARRRGAENIYSKIGRAIRLLEESGSTPAENESAELMRSLNLIESLRNHGTLNQCELDALRDRIVGLYRQAVDLGERRVRVHGDLTPSNILVHSGRVGLLDFTWPVRFGGHDVYRFIQGLERARPTIPKWTRTLIRCVLDGYGDPDLVNRPSWALKQLHDRLAAVAKVRADGRRHMSALRELKTAI